MIRGCERGVWSGVPKTGSEKVHQESLKSGTKGKLTN